MKRLHENMRESRPRTLATTIVLCLLRAAVKRRALQRGEIKKQKQFNANVIIFVLLALLVAIRRPGGTRAERRRNYPGKLWGDPAPRARSIGRQFRLDEDPGMMG
jgi:hypothetical protein